MGLIRLNADNYLAMKLPRPIKEAVITVNGDFEVGAGG